LLQAFVLRARLLRARLRPALLRDAAAQHVEQPDRLPPLLRPGKLLRRGRLWRGWLLRG
jgi:hypothetical protein